MSLIMGLDLGTSSIKCMMMDESASVVSVCSASYPSLYPHPGWVEQNPAEWVCAMKKVLAETSRRVNMKDLSAVSLSGHMSGVVLLDREGKPAANCITLSDCRSDEECREIRDLAGDRIDRNCRNPVINAFSAPKLLWLKKNAPEAFRNAAVYLAPKDYLRYLLTGRLATETTDAYNTLLLKSSACSWDMDLIHTLGLPESIFPPVRKPFDLAGAVSREAAEKFSLPGGVPVVMGAADMACGALGIGVTDPGDAAVTLGTSATFLMAVKTPSQTGHGRITYHLHALPNCYYALGSHFNGGLALNWLVSQFSETGEISYKLSDHIAKLAARIPNGSNPVLNIPFFVGSGSPYFNSNDAGAFLNVSQSCRPEYLFKSILEGISFNLLQTLQIFEEIRGGKLRNISLGGGGIRVAGWNQIITDVFGRTTRLVRQADASTVGACILGGYGAGVFQDLKAAARRTFSSEAENVPNRAAHEKYRRIFNIYLHAYQAIRQIQQELHTAL